MNQGQAIRMLYQGRVDLNVNNDIGFMATLRKINLNPNEFKKIFIISKMPLCIAANKETDDALVKKMRAALEKVKSDGTHRRLMNKWFPGVIDLDGLK